MKLKLINQTTWSTRSLRKFVMRGLEEYDVPWPHYSVEVVPAHQGNWCSGLACYHSPWIRMRIPSPDDVARRGNLRKIIEDFARVLEHEILHNLGERHDDMKEDGYDCRTGDAPDWVNGLTLEPRKAKAKPTAKDRVKARDENARKMVARWERKLKLARTKLRYWQGKTRYYDRRSAAAGVPAASAMEQAKLDAAVQHGRAVADQVEGKLEGARP